MDEQQVEQQLESCQKKAESFFNAVRDQHVALMLPFSGTGLPDGFNRAPGSGAILLPSPTEMRDLADLISLVLSSWTQSGKMPTVEALHSSAQSAEVDPVVYITTLYSTAMLGAFLPVICSGDLATAYSTLDVMNQAEGLPGTSPSTFSRKKQRNLNGPFITGSTERTQRPPSPPSKKGKRAGKSTRPTGSAKKKSHTVNPGRKRKKKKASN